MSEVDQIVDKLLEQEEEPDWGVRPVGAPKRINFRSFRDRVHGKEGIVLLGAGGDPMEWINGVAGLLRDEGITNVSADVLFPERYILTTSGGRTDLALVTDLGRVDTGKLAMWRLRFGDCSWISDYLVNYADQHEELVR